MAFLFDGPESGHTERQGTRRCAGLIATVLFHPDFDRRPRIHTESADPCCQKHDPEKWEPVFPRDKRGTRLRGDHAQTATRRSRAWAISPLPPVGNFTPP